MGQYNRGTPARPSVSETADDPAGVAEAHARLVALDEIGITELLIRESAGREGDPLILLFRLGLLEIVGRRHGGRR